MNYLILLLLWPFAEIALLTQIASRIGGLGAVSVCIASALAGFMLLQWQGLKTLESVRAAMIGGDRTPPDDIFDSMCLVLSGVLLILPGVISDAMALMLLLSPGRKYLRRKIGFRFDVPARSGNGADSQGVIDGEFTRLDGDGKPLLKSNPHSDHVH